MKTLTYNNCAYDIHDVIPETEEEKRICDKHLFRCWPGFTDHGIKKIWHEFINNLYV